MFQQESWEQLPEIEEDDQDVVQLLGLILNLFKKIKQGTKKIVLRFQAVLQNSFNVQNLNEVKGYFNENTAKVIGLGGLELES